MYLKNWFAKIRGRGVGMMPRPVRLHELSFTKKIGYHILSFFELGRMNPMPAFIPSAITTVVWFFVYATTNLSWGIYAVIIFGAKPVFCEIDPNTLNIDVTKIEELITPKTKMILPIDYAGISCEIDEIMQIAEKHDLIVMQDSAQSYGGYYKNKPNGSIPHLTAFSFHETKNMNAGGEGGGLVVIVAP